MLLLLALALTIAVLACVFALQNSQPVAITFLSLKYEASMALVLIGAFAAGAVVGLLAVLPAVIKGKFELSKLRAGLREKIAGPSAPPPPKRPS